MTKMEIVGALNQEANLNPVFKDFALVCASRQRARKNLTISSLARKMKAEGFKYRDKELEAIFKKLSHLGLGTIDLDQKGRIRALKDIKVTLQSIGSAALGVDNKDLMKFYPRAKFGKIVPIHSSNPTPVLQEAAAALKVTLTVFIGSKSICVPVPADLSPSETAALISRLQK